MLFFDHDTEAYKDDKVMLLRHAHGGAAVDAYWTILERIYHDECELQTTGNPVAFESLAFFLQTTVEELQKWIDSMVKYQLLTKNDDGSLMSPRAAEKIGSYKDRCLKNKENASKRKSSDKTPDENAEVDESSVSGSQSVANELQPVVSESVAIRPVEEEGEVEVEEEVEEDKENHPNPPRGEAEEFPFDEIIGYLNAKTSRNFKASTESYRKHIRARCKEGYTLDDFKRVIDGRCAVWNKPPKPGDDKDTRDWLNPDTLFRASNFDRYLNGVSSAIPTEEVSSLAAKYANAY